MTITIDTLFGPYPNLYLVPPTEEPTGPVSLHKVPLPWQVQGDVWRALVDTQAELTHDKAQAARTHQAQVQRINYLQEQLRKYERDAETISSMLMEAARDNDLCQVYDRTVERINRATEIITLDQRVRDYDVTVTVTFNVTVEATDEDEAAEKAESDVADNVTGNYDIGETYVSEA